MVLSSTTLCLTPLGRTLRQSYLIVMFHYINNLNHRYGHWKCTSEHGGLDCGPQSVYPSLCIVLNLHLSMEDECQVIDSYSPHWGRDLGKAYESSLHLPCSCQLWSGSCIFLHTCRHLGNYLLPSCLTGMGNLTFCSFWASRTVLRQLCFCTVAFGSLSVPWKANSVVLCVQP